MPEFAALSALFVSAFTSATLLPGSSEAVLIALLSAGTASPALLVAVAAAGNLIGSVVNWVLGRSIARFRDRRWFPVGPAAYARAESWYRRWGLWSLLLAWVPVIGDPLTVVAGALRVGFWRFVILVGIGKTGRYAFIAAAHAMFAPG
jgi:membrane protein YqaA with SNARE-associated domain